MPPHRRPAKLAILREHDDRHLSDQRVTRQDGQIGR